MKEIELRSCPFCGNITELHERYHSIEEIAYKKSEIPKDAKFLYEKVYTKKRIYVYRRKTFIPRCTDTSCVGRTTKIFFDKDIAIDAWNRRADNKQSVGEWKLGKSGCIYLCSSCGYSAFPREEEEWTFCPRCGTKMKGGAE